MFYVRKIYLPYVNMFDKIIQDILERFKNILNNFNGNGGYTK